MEGKPIDANFCPSCGETLPIDKVKLYADDTLDRYRSTFYCPECGYAGEIIRDGGIEPI